MKKRIMILMGAWYLPDFWLPRQEIWFEVKGNIPSLGEYQKAKRLCELSGMYVCLAIGSMKLPVRCNIQEAIDGQWTQLLIYNPEDKAFLQFNNPYPYPDPCTWCECPTCGKLEIVE